MFNQILKDIWNRLDGTKEIIKYLTFVGDDLDAQFEDAHNLIIRHQRWNQLKSFSFWKSRGFQKAEEAATICREKLRVLLYYHIDNGKLHRFVCSDSVLEFELEGFAQVIESICLIA